MDIKITNSMYKYFEILYHINQRLLKICGTNVLIDYKTSFEILLNRIQDISKVIPYINDINKVS